MNPPSDVAAAKAALRERFQQARLALSHDDYQAASQGICNRLLAEPEVAAAATISVYWPILVRREVDTRSLIEHLFGSGRRVVLPVVIDLASAPAMGHVAYSGEENLQPNRWGLLEPAGKPVPADEIDAVVVPALGAGRNLHRLGYGRGFYDAFLSRSAAPALGAVFAACLIDEIPHETHDAPLRTIITEEEIVRSGSFPGRNP